MCCFFIQSPLCSNIPPLHCGQIVHKVNVMMGYIETEIFVIFEMGSFFGQINKPETHLEYPAIMAHVILPRNLC